MKKFLRIASLILVTLLFVSYDSLKAQVKIGGNPADIDPNALLELESNRKGLLLPRLNDAGFNALQAANPKEGFIIYHTGSLLGGPGFYLKSGTGINDWTKMAATGTVDQTWKLTGNNNADANSFMGTINPFPLVLKANNNEGLRVLTTGKLQIPLANLDVDNTLNELLLVAPDGTLKRKNLSITAVKSLNGKSDDVTLTFQADGTLNDVEIDNTTDPQDVKLKLPVMEGNAGQNYGFLQFADWEKLNDLTANDGISMGALLTDDSQGADGAVVSKTGNKFMLQMGAASNAAAGLVTVGAQEFAGVKTIDGDLIVTNNGLGGGTGSLTVGGKLTVQGLDPAGSPTTFNMLVQEGAAGTELKTLNIPAWKLNAGIGSVNGVGGATADGDMTLEAGTAGTDFAIAPDAVQNKIVFNLPDASATARGLVTTGTQTIAGEKTFSSKVSVGPGAAGSSNLTLNGSFGAKFRQIASGNINADDYIVLVKAAAAATVTLPDATTCSGRIYVIKRLPVVEPVDELMENFDITIASAGGTFHGSANTKITVPYTAVTVMSDGTNWQIMSRGPGL